MLMLALTKDNEIIHIKDALVKTDYYCDKCGGILRVRNGKIRVKHFYHLNEDCGSEGESLIHKYWKNYFLNLKEFDGYKIEDSRQEIPLLKGTYVPDIVLKTDKRTYIIIEVFYKNSKTEDYKEKLKRLKNLERAYEIKVDFEKILNIKILFDVEKNREDIKRSKEKEMKKEKLTKDLFREVERKRQYILDKYSKKGGLIYNIINSMLCTHSVSLNKLKINNRCKYNKFIEIQDIIYNSLKCQKFKIYLEEILDFEDKIISVKSNPFCINIYDYNNFLNHLRRNNNSIKFYSKDENLKGNISISLDDEEIKKLNF